MIVIININFEILQILTAKINHYFMAVLFSESFHVSSYSQPYPLQSSLLNHNFIEISQ